MAASDLDHAFAMLRAAATGLPSIEESTSYGTPALKVKGKLLARVKDADTLVLHCPVEDKAVLIAAAPKIFFETPHYHGYALVLAHVKTISAKELKHRIELAWRANAPKKLLAALDAERQ
ncbi:MmcQ/YjbR family DNA-binding protein [Roseiterribacter gracilis]|uniref:MmcQ/YjbR family DNA-binding protein n=1 Tax=Roseiterribacter gracilis TaxID=2812848 RepID=A0A8S8XK72_9PROT|nr:hypothetical protein TMPK1_34270 [Rhodospirillales bacterium TMPK1]